MKNVVILGFMLILIIISSCYKMSCYGERKDIAASYKLVKNNDTIYLYINKTGYVDPLKPVRQSYIDSVKTMLSNGYKIFYRSEFFYKSLDCNDCGKIKQFGDSNTCIQCTDLVAPNCK